MRDFLVNLFRYFGVPIVAGLTLITTLIVLMVISPKVETTYFGVANTQQCSAIKKQNPEINAIGCMKASVESEEIAKYHNWQFTQAANCTRWFSDRSCYRDSTGQWRVKPSGFAIAVNDESDSLSVSPLYFSPRLNTHLLPNLTPARYGKQVLESFSADQSDAITKYSTSHTFSDKGCIYEDGSSSKTCSDRGTFLLRYRTDTRWAN